jgi:hypothetical protein
LVFAAINSTSLGVKVKDSTTGRTFAPAIAGASANARTAAIRIDLIFMTLPNLVPTLLQNYEKWLCFGGG